MKVLVDAIPMTGLLTGVARYLRNLYGAMEEMNRVDISYCHGGKTTKAMPPLAASDQRQMAIGAVRSLPDPVVFGLRAARWLKYEHQLVRACGKGSFDLYHETAFTPAKLTGVPTLFSIYDLSLRRYRETHPKERVWLFEHFIKSRLRYATHILTISEFIRNEIIDEFNVSPAMVTSVPLAPDPLFTPCDQVAVDAVRTKYRLPGSYLLFVSSLEPRKNIALLMAALKAAKTDIPLVLVGWQGWGDKHWMKAINDFKNPVHLLGHVSDQDLRAIYSGGMGLVYPSLYEGFGLPILEAMACGCPVICSDAASMPAVAGSAALLIDPADSEGLAFAIDTLVYDTHKRNDLVKRGKHRAAGFTWNATAEKTLDVFKRVAK